MAGMIKPSNKSVEEFEDYDGFVEKFKQKKTTDDCYTPPLVYDAVADWTAREYGLDRADFVRPFYPGRDYRAENYDGKIVVDNPPFSILSQIIRFYCSYGIRFLLFAPTLSGLVRYADICTVFPTGADIEYENGAIIATSFVTNMDPHDIRARTVPDLYAAVTAANDAVRKEKRKELPKYTYPLYLVTSAQMYPLARYGIEFVVRRSESMRVSRLDAQIPEKKQIFGCGWLVSEHEKAEREKAEREKAEREKAEREKAEREKAEREKAARFHLSEREWAIVAMLDRKGSRMRKKAPERMAFLCGGCGVRFEADRAQYRVRGDRYVCGCPQCGKRCSVEKSGEEESQDGD